MALGVTPRVLGPEGGIPVAEILSRLASHIDLDCIGRSEKAAGAPVKEQGCGSEAAAIPTAKQQPIPQ